MNKAELTSLVEKLTQERANLQEKLAKNKAELAAAGADLSKILQTEIDKRRSGDVQKLMAGGVPSSGAVGKIGG